MFYRTLYRTKYSTLKNHFTSQKQPGYNEPRLHRTKYSASNNHFTSQKNPVVTNPGYITNKSGQSRAICDNRFLL